MRKLFIIAVIIAIFEIPSSTPAFSWDFNWGWSPKKDALPSRKPSPPKASPPQHYIELLELIKELIKINTKELKQSEDIYKSITGNRGINPKQLENIQTDQTSFFLKDPQLIYDKNSNISASKSESFNDILKEEKIPDSIHEARKSIEERRQYATAIDKNISLKAFQNTDARLKHILVLLEKIDETKDLKDIAELQARIKGMLAIIQNENAKLQMVAHLRETEREFIEHQKYKRNMRMLNSKNKKMPTIHFIR